MRRPSAHRGFTLVEVLIATALLALVMLGLLTSMRSFAQMETRIDERIRQDDDLRLSDRFLRAVLSSIAPVARNVAAGAPKQIDFSGGAEAMRWIGVMPARHGAGGLYRFHLYARPATADGPPALMLEFAPYVPGFEAPLDAAAVQMRVLAVEAEGVRFRYQEDPTAGEAWLEEWPHADRLPRRVALTVNRAAQLWPEVVVAVLPASGPTPAARGGLNSAPMIGPL